MIHRNNIQVTIIGCMALMILWLFVNQEPRADFHRLCARIDHAIDISQDLQELSQNIAIKEQIDLFGNDSHKNAPITDLAAISTILECKSKQIFTTLHPVLCELKKNCSN